MNVINVGFNDKYWSVLMESSDEYQSVLSAVEEGDGKVDGLIFSTITALLQGDFESAHRSAFAVLKASKGETVESVEDTKCVFCDGTGNVEGEVGGEEPWDSRTVEVACDACKGEGRLPASELLEYIDSTAPVYLIMDVIRGKMDSARKTAIGIIDSIMSANEGENLSKSLEVAI